MARRRGNLAGLWTGIAAGAIGFLIPFVVFALLGVRGVWLLVLGAAGGGIAVLVVLRANRA